MNGKSSSVSIDNITLLGENCTTNQKPGDVCIRKLVDCILGGLSTGLGGGLNTEEVCQGGGGGWLVCPIPLPTKEDSPLKR